jgi:hypothetical protein
VVTGLVDFFEICKAGWLKVETTCVLWRPALLLLGRKASCLILAYTNVFLWGTGMQYQLG